MVAVTCKFDTKGLQPLMDFIRDRPNRVDAAVKRTAKKAWMWITRDTPHRTGTAQGSWQVKQNGLMRYMVISDVNAGKKYTPFLEDGTYLFGPFEVAPKGYGKNPRIKGGMIGVHMVGRNEPAIQDQLNYEIQRTFEKYMEAQASE